MAAYIGYLGMPLAGVLISGGGFPQTPVGSQVPFDLFAAAGTEDFNLLEVRGIVNIVARAKKPHRFAVFEGSHQWADAATMREAIEWFELRAMTGGRRTRDDALIAELWTRRVERVERVAGLLARQGELAALVRDFESLRDVGPQKRALEDLEKSKEFKEARRAQEKLEERERLIVDRLSALGGADGESQWRDEVARFRKMSAAGSDSDERRLARRLLGGQAVGAIEASRAAMQEKRYGEAARLLRRAVLLRPEAAGLHYELARALALAGDRQPALNELRAAVEAGFEDRARLAADPAFDRLRGDEAFRELLARIQ
ncbi:MAG TPA: hypothetical protein DEH78_16740 [Solibacterales bacterium]|nr:hypothetical protein [Bryobacterales bacterium]